MSDEAEGIFCPECGALLIFGERVEKNGETFILFKCGHKISAALRIKKEKGRAVLFEMIYDRIY